MTDNISPWQQRVKTLEDQWLAAAEQGVKDTYVYRYFDQNNVLLYVGQTTNPARRHTAHKCRAAWFGLIARREVRGPMTRAWALLEEFVALGLEDPRYNEHAANGHAGPGSRHWDVAMAAEFGRLFETEPELWKAEAEWTSRRIGEVLASARELAS